jgi:Raf kinase inhibitor-like YbhB/YbcL family protein
VAHELQFFPFMKSAITGLLALLIWGNPVIAESNLVIKSNAFKNEEDIPTRHTCEGANISPDLSWAGAPASTKSFALIIDDPDAPDPAKPEKIFTHWVLYNIPSTAGGLSEGQQTLPKGTQAGLNDFGKTEYAGPCPPIGKHRYFFRLFALDNNPHFVARPNKTDLEKAMVGHILAQSEVVGLYAKKNH